MLSLRSKNMVKALLCARKCFGIVTHPVRTDEDVLICLMRTCAFHFAVLPSFEVKLKPESPFFYVDSQELIVNIEAT